MRVLGLDIGEKRIGVAVSDPSGTVASPLTVLDAASALANGADLVRIAEDYDVGAVVVGLPLSMDGTEGPQTQTVRNAAQRLAGFLRVPFEFADERLSSVEASRAMEAAGVTSRQARGRVDSVAASVFLQSYLDARRTDERIGEQ
jgi:putative Holliday junction resolvase